MTVVPEPSEERPEDAAGAGDETQRAGKRTRQLQRFSPENPLLTSEEVAELLGVSPKTVVQMAKRGSLPARHIPGTRRYLFFEREIFELLDASTVVPAAGKGDIDAEEEETDAPETVTAPRRARVRSTASKKAQKKA
jgi:excisionase family DNA binding protein